MVSVFAIATQAADPARVTWSARRAAWTIGVKIVSTPVVASTTHALQLASQTLERTADFADLLVSNGVGSHDRDIVIRGRLAVVRRAAVQARMGNIQMTSLCYAWATVSWMDLAVEKARRRVGTGEAYSRIGTSLVGLRRRDVFFTYNVCAILDESVGGT